jgi:hypothetical protein
VIAPHVASAIDELKACFPDLDVIVEPDGSGGARVLIERVPLGGIYSTPDTWFGAHIPVQIPYADVYPHFIRGDLARNDGKPLGEALSNGHAFMNRSAVQASRRSNGRDPSIETAALKFLKVLEWIRSRP